MEELLLALLHFLVEVVLQTLVSFPFDILLDLLPERFALSRKGPRAEKLSLTFAGLFVGGALGFLSVWIVPLASIRSSPIRVGTLVFGPLLVASGSRAIAKMRRKPGTRGASPDEHFWLVLGLSGAFLLVRFYLAER